MDAESKKSKESFKRIEDQDRSLSSSPTPQTDQYKETVRRRRKKKKKKAKEDTLAKIPGVKKMVLSELTQKIIGCVAGEQVTSENPWIYVNKEVVQDNLELHEESSEFLPVRNDILLYPRDQILIDSESTTTEDVEEYRALAFYSDEESGDESDDNNSEN